jgi:hypothetical protein
MLTLSRDTIRASQKVTRLLVEKKEGLVKKFKNFSLPEFGIQGENFMAILEGRDGSIDPLIATKCAVRMDNFLQYTVGNAHRLDETSRASLPAWIKNGLALIAAAQADDILDRIISNQALQTRNGYIHYLDINTERAKGNIPDRARLFDALAGFRGTQDFSGEDIPNETVGQPGGTDFGTTVAPVILGYGPVVPGTLVITDGVQVVRDDRNGNIVGDVGAPGGGVTNTIDYLTRHLSFRFAAAATGVVVANYKYNIEAALQYPEYGISIRRETMEARPRAVGASWSQQVVFDFMREYGVDAEPTIIEAGARIINQEKFKHVVNMLRANATGGAVVFDNTAPVGVSYPDHLVTASIYLSRLQDLVYEATQLVRPNVFVYHPSIQFLVAFQPGYEGQKYANDGVAGPRYVGRLSNHDLDCFVDPTYVRNQGLLTHRGPEFVSTAAVMGTYIDLYKSAVFARGFRKDIAMLTEYAVKIVDPNQIATFNVISL